MYQSGITRNHRTAFVFLLDCSGSMAEQITFGNRQMPKAAAVAEITNDLLFELCERARRSDGVRDYYDIAILGYSGDDEVSSLLPGGREMISITELSSACHATRHEIIRQVSPSEPTQIYEFSTPEWIRLHAEGRTPMCEAFRHARDLVAAWVARPENAASFPPVVFNITDGEATDNVGDELRDIAAEIRGLHTLDGNVLLMNIHIANSDQASSIFFPSEHEADYANRNAGLLYDCSSSMPEMFNGAIREVKGLGACPPFRAMSFNASPAELVAMLNIGSISVKTE